MSTFKKRKLNGTAPSPVVAPPKTRPSSSKPSSQKPALQRPEPESTDDEVAEEETNTTDAHHSSPEAEDEPTTAGGSSEAKKTFADLGVREELCDACENLKFTTPTPIQVQSIPLALEGRDVIGLAETGSGKTAAFVLPILQSLLEKPQALFGLIMAPTRELAYQIAQQVDALGSIINVKCATLVGGMDMVPQAIALSKRPHIVVATPGRLLDHLENTKGFSLKYLKYLVLDEADRLLDLDFGPVLDKILKVLPRDGRHTYLFSATMSSKVESLQRAALQNPVRVSISSSSHQVVSTLLQRYFFLPHKHKDLYLIHLLNDNIGHPTIIFTRTVNETQRIAVLLRTLGFGAIPLHGQLSQSARLGALSKFRSRSRDILVATDVASRGLDIPSVDLVVNLDLPSDSQTYVHRVGRTARAGKSGKAVSFVTQYDVEIWLRIENALGSKIEEEVIDKDEAMVYMERVSEAQRVAIREMKDIHEQRGKGRGGGGGGRGRGGGFAKRGRDHMDREEG
ncbi:DEAD-domain-containing protein [Cucurbitaria berberidis CBS 394.84]|uniref:DEAD-domain-containing protein n=1 Tax=Cucurbitaria berberidis CBS 394.84 TaxID=1168544 RepID=A0A9P4L5E0_9PLEO|nr:DEAD-domain-containing protein [Cucurbitaria berberidis CBS 394.84]KAF1842224.1 DEAD-domain-containing protein [Cucurbitaria berberidis CBS 394.84]